MSSVIHGLLILFLSLWFFDKKTLSKENRNWCFGLGLLNAIFFIYMLILGIVAIGESRGGFAGIALFLTALHGFAAYRLYQEIRLSLSEILQDLKSLSLPQEIGRLLKDENFNFWLALGLSGEVILMVFQRWFKLKLLDFLKDFLSGSSAIPTKFTLFQFSKALNEIGIKSFGLMAAVLIITALLVIAAQGFFIYTLLVNSPHKKKAGTAAAITTSLVVVCVFILVKVYNASFARETGGLFNLGLSLTAVPYFAALISLVVRFFVLERTINHEGLKPRQ